MNIRISKKQIRFRITKEELATLGRGEKLVLQSPLGVNPSEYIIDVSEEPESLTLEERGGNLVLFVNKKLLAKLGERLPSKDGIENEVLINDQLVEVVLEVDIKRRQ